MVTPAARRQLVGDLQARYQVSQRHACRVIPISRKAMFFFNRQRQVKLLFIQPGKPTQNAFVESFNGRFRDGCLDQQWFKDLNDARSIIDAWRRHYNEERPHSSLGYKPPREFEQQAA